MKPSSSSTIFFFFSAGIITGLFVFLFLLTFLTTDDLADFSATQGGTVAAIATFIAVLVAWIVHQEQLEYQEQRAEVDRSKKNNVLRAHMHSAIVELMRYTERCYRLMHVNPGNHDAPEQPSEPIKLLANSIEFADDTSANSLRDIVSSFQIFGSRYESGQETLADLERNLLAIHMQIENVLLYARHDTETLSIIPRSLSSLQRSARSISRNIEQPLQDRLYQATLARLNNYYSL